VDVSRSFDVRRSAFFNRLPSVCFVVPILVLRNIVVHLNLNLRFGRIGRSTRLSAVRVSRSRLSSSHIHSKVLVEGMLECFAFLVAYPPWS